MSDERPPPCAGDGSPVAAREVVGPPGPRQRKPESDWGRSRSRALGASILAAGLICGVLTAAKVQLSLSGNGSGMVTPHRAALAASDDQERNTRLARVTMPMASDTEDVGAVRWTEPLTPRMAAVFVESAVAQPEAVGPIGPARTVEPIVPPNVVSGLPPDRAAQPRVPALTARTLSPHEMVPLTAAPTVLARTEPMQEPADVIAAIVRPVTSVPPAPVAKAPTRLASPAAETAGSTHRSHARAAPPVARVEPSPVRNARPPRATVERPRPGRVAAHARNGVRRTGAIAPMQTPHPVRPAIRDVAHAEGIGGIALPASLRPTPF
ncbi:hypothetical protein Q8W71_31535 [Methylobacterium sp. NEAU 140]|uniref:hypothetical protein n=1 Tax=Methylobacterium sp. NEAU 140 TaxID=3064945 RepID=UPI0027345CD4|nr:hypothetical protein [Methylobacterium sp. NEAU 140]MDP4027118.1 hypothetical protein [Methylobacterium sp. NEAU 140]